MTEHAAAAERSLRRQSSEVREAACQECRAESMSRRAPCNGEKFRGLRISGDSGKGTRRARRNDREGGQARQARQLCPGERRKNAFVQAGETRVSSHVRRLFLDRTSAFRDDPICPLGTRSASGIKTHSVLPSLVQTARRQGVDPRKFLQTLLTADTSTAQAALYNDSS